MIHKTEVYLDILSQRQEVGHDGNHVGDVHEENGVGAPQLRSFFTNASHVDAEITDSDKATHNSEEAVKHVHGKTATLIPPFQNNQFKRLPYLQRTLHSNEN